MQVMRVEVFILGLEKVRLLQPLLAVRQLVANFLWSPTFFGLHSIGLALVIILVLLVLILTFIGITWRTDRTASVLFLPYAAWVAFATALNAAIFFLN